MTESAGNPDACGRDPASAASRIELYIHIGLHKTGSTFLQEKVFPLLDGIDYLGKPYKDRHLERWIWRTSTKVLLSNEQFSSSYVGQFLAGGDGRWHRHRQQCLNRLAALFPHAAILMGIRRQSDYVLSLYSQYLGIGGSADLAEFWAPEGEKGLLVGDDLLMAPVIRHVAATWPRCFVFLLEELSRMDRLLGDMTAFMGLDAAPSLKSTKPLNPKVSADTAARLLSYNRSDEALQDMVARRKLLAGMVEEDQAQPQDVKTSLSLPPELRQRIDSYYEEDWREALELIASLRGHRETSHYPAIGA